MVGCVIGSKDKVWKQISSLFFIKRPSATVSSVFAQSIYLYINKVLTIYCIHWMHPADTLV